ncbi:MAG: phytanoyl-CoA dioxygenase family protein [Verrucomicrobiales bacterium]|nr:phytanoyl-CoA dioxygenase family protein [Verrucomicrobiales bacterium]
MSDSFSATGFKLIRNAIHEEEVAELRGEVARLGVCARNISSGSERIRSLAEKVGERFADGRKCVRSLLFDKTPQKNWPVAWHQDMTIAVAERRDVPGYGPWSVKEGVTCVQPPVEVLESMVTIRIHLDDTNADNGALKVIPGSHTRGRILQNEIVNLIGNCEICACRAGDILLMSPLILHASSRSIVPFHRRVLHFEYADPTKLSELLRWQELDKSSA